MSRFINEFAIVCVHRTCMIERSKIPFSSAGKLDIGIISCSSNKSRLLTMVYHMDIGLRAEQETMVQKPVFEPCCLPGVILSFAEHRRENYGMKLERKKISFTHYGGGHPGHVHTHGIDGRRYRSRVSQPKQLIFEIVTLIGKTFLPILKDKNEEAKSKSNTVDLMMI